MKYRPHVDGLRAIALLWVLGFHFFPVVFRGGFTGVDFFFVLSGFLITRKVFAQMGTGDFSLARFYFSRARRLLPPLALMLAAVLTAGWFLLLQDEYVQVARHAVATLVGVPNFQILHDSGYFTAGPHTKPLLHLWSLGVEEQFYLFWPVLLLVGRRTRKTGWGIFLLGLASFALNCFWVGRYPERAFFHPLSRLWELALGGFLAHVETRRLSPRLENCGAFVGSALVLGSLALGSANYPGPLALLPTLGAALLVHCGGVAWLSSLLENPPLRRAGRLSYAWYLWHWPALVLLELQWPAGIAWPLRVGALALSYLLAEGTHALVERPVRNLSPRGQRGAVAFAALAAVLIAGFGRAVVMGKLQSPLQRDSQFYSSFARMGGTEARSIWALAGCFARDWKTETFDANHCAQVANPHAPTVMLVGDSQAAYLSFGMRSVVEKSGANFVTLSAPGCLPYELASAPGCAHLALYIERAIARIKPDRLVVFSQHHFYLEHPLWKKNYFSTLAGKLRQFGEGGAKSVVLLGQMPQWKGELPKFAFREYERKRLAMPARTREFLVADSLTIDEELARLKLPGNVRFLSLTSLFCNEEGCLTKVGRVTKEYIVYDHIHVSALTANYLSGLVLQDMRLARR